MCAENTFDVALRGAQCAPLRYNMCQSFNAVRRVVAPYDICNIKHEKGKPSFLFTLENS